MSHKSQKIATLIQGLQGQELDPHYLGYFECFNQQLFFEAHEVLEELWLGGRGGPQDRFYKGLIQLAGAFVHVQKRRLGPALALLNLARKNLEVYPAVHERLNIAAVLTTIDWWLQSLKQLNEPWPTQIFPQLSLVVASLPGNRP